MAFRKKKLSISIHVFYEILVSDTCNGDFTQKKQMDNIHTLFVLVNSRTPHRSSVKFLRKKINFRASAFLLNNTSY